MIVAAIDHSSGAIPLPPLLLRGRDVPFWQQKICRAIPFRPLTETGVPFDFLLVFDGSRFFYTRDEGVGEIVTKLEALDSGAERALALTPLAPLTSFASSPFIAVSRAFFERNRSVFRTGVFSTLAGRISLEEMKMENCFEVFRPDQDPQRAEEWVMRLQIREYRRRGVVISDFGHFYIEGELSIGEGSVISTGVVIRGNSEIGRGTVLYPHCYIENSRIGDRCVLLPGTVIIDSIVEENVQLGPYTHLRNGSLVKKGAKMGNFVEMKKSVLGSGSKSMHLAYIGDATVGENVNIGAGTITCNYDGEKKNPTFIEDNVFVGSGTELVAPVTVGRNSFIAAGSTITEDVPENSLAIARQRQANIADWALRRREKKKV